MKGISDGSQNEHALAAAEIQEEAGDYRKTPMARAIREQGATVIELDPRYDGLDPVPIDQLANLLLEVTSAEAKPRLVLDFSHTRYMSSMAVDVLVRCWKRLRERDGHMALCHLNEFCSEVLHIVRLDTIWHIEPTREAALAWVNKPEDPSGA